MENEIKVFFSKSLSEYDKKPVGWRTISLKSVRQIIENVNRSENKIKRATYLEKTVCKQSQWENTYLDWWDKLTLISIVWMDETNFRGIGKQRYKFSLHKSNGI